MEQSVQSSPDETVSAPDSRAPSQAIWDQMTPEERARAVLALPANVPAELLPPEGDAHRRAKVSALQALDGFFRRIGRKVYVSSDLAIFYPDEPRIVPDLFVVMDADTHDRTKWVVSSEGKGPDFVLEVQMTSAVGADEEPLLKRYAALGIAEFFLLDRTRRRLRGYRLSRKGPQVYEPIPLEEGRLRSRVLGLDVTLDGHRVRFLYATAALPDEGEIITRLGTLVNETMAAKEEAERRADQSAKVAEEALERAEEALRRVEEARVRAEGEARRAEELRVSAEHTEQRLAEALSELHKMKGWE